jgi:hypothetical protein
MTQVGRFQARCGASVVCVASRFSGLGMHLNEARLPSRMTSAERSEVSAWPNDRQVYTQLPSVTIEALGQPGKRIEIREDGAKSCRGVKR